MSHSRDESPTSNGDQLTFGDTVLIVKTNDVPEVEVGDQGEIAGMSEGGQHVGVFVERLRRVYTIPINQVQKVKEAG